MISYQHIYLVYVITSLPEYNIADFNYYGSYNYYDKDIRTEIPSPLFRIGY